MAQFKLGEKYMSKIKDYYIDREPKGFNEYLDKIEPTKMKYMSLNELFFRDHEKYEKLAAEAESRERDLSEGWEPK